MDPNLEPITQRGFEPNQQGPDYDIGRRNLMEINDTVHRKMLQFASRIGGRYIPPSVGETLQKINESLNVNPHIFYQVDRDGTIWAPEGKSGIGLKNVEAYNTSGKFGFIVMDSGDRKEKPKEETVRLYRGCSLNPDIPQVAPLARVEGINVQDIYDYVNGKISMDEIIAKARDKEIKKYLLYSLNKIRENAQTNGNTEFEQTRLLHTAFTSGAIDIDLWVSAAYEPTEIYSTKNMGNVYADFISESKMQAVLILDVPKSKLADYSTEAGILAEIKPEYIRAIIPASGDVTEGVKKAEEYLKNNS